MIYQADKPGWAMRQAFGFGVRLRPYHSTLGLMKLKIE